MAMGGRVLFVISSVFILRGEGSLRCSAATVGIERQPGKAQRYLRFSAMPIMDMTGASFFPTRAPDPASGQKKRIVPAGNRVREIEDLNVRSDQ